MEPESASETQQKRTISPMNRRGLTVLEVVAIFLIVALLVVMLTPLLAKRRQVMRRSACAGNLKQIGLALNMYANENKDRYPPIDDTKNNFMFDANLLYPEYLSDHMLAMCPADPHWDPDTTFRLVADHPIDGTPKGQVHPDCFTDDSYIYLGWMVMSDKEVGAFCEAYDKLPVEDYDGKINVAKGWGTLEGDTIHRLSFGVERFLITDLNAAGSMAGGSATVPIMWDRPYTDTARYTHQPIGGNVLYLDGHVSYFRYGEGIGVWDYIPLTETMARLLEEHPRKPIPNCE